MYNRIHTEIKPSVFYQLKTKIFFKILYFHKISQNFYNLFHKNKRLGKINGVLFLFLIHSKIKRVRFLVYYYNIVKTYFCSI